MKLSFATLGCPDWTLEEIAANAAEMGFDGVELRGAAGNHIGADETPTELRRIREMFAAADVALAAIMGYTNYTGDDEERALAIAHTKQFIDVAATIGCPTLRVFGGVNEDISRAAAKDRVATALNELSPIAEAKGVTLALETHDAWCEGANLADILAAVPSPAFGVCWDVANAWFQEPLEETYGAIKERIVHVHFKDAATSDDGSHHSVLPGKGEVGMREALELLVADGYDAWLSFEWEKKWEPDLEDPEVAFPHYLAFTKALLADLR